MPKIVSFSVKILLFLASVSSIKFCQKSFNSVYFSTSKKETFVAYIRSFGAIKATNDASMTSYLVLNL